MLYDINSSHFFIWRRFMALLDKIIEEIEQTGDKIIDEQGTIFSEQIKQYAQDFMNVIVRDKQELERIKKMLKSQKETIRAIQQASVNSTYEWRTQIENRHQMIKRDYYRQMITASLKFQTQLNELLNQKVELVYVYQDEKNNPVMYTIDENSLSAALYYQSNKGKISGRFRQNRNDFLSYLNNLTKYQLYEKFNLQYFNYTYKQVIWRFNYGHKKKSDLIMWLNPNFGTHETKWLKAMVNKQGDIKEAYASVILDRQINSTKLFNDEKLDNNVHQFMLEVAKVDSESGLLKGDVTVGQTEYAIKGVAASTLGLQQVIQVAQTILGKATYTKEDLQKQKEDFHKKAGTRNHVQTMGRKTFKKWNDDLAKIIETKNNTNMGVLIHYEPSDISWFD